AQGNLGDRAGALVRPRRPKRHAEGRRSRVRLAGDARAARNGDRAARGEHARVPRATGHVAMRRILFLARAEVLHVVRDRATLAQVLIVPILQLLVLSNAATFQISNTPTYIVDLDRTSASRSVITRFAASGHFQVVGDSPSLVRANDALLGGDVTMVL